MAKFEIETEYETVHLLRAGPAAKIELNRPESLNAWNGQMSADLFAAYETVRDDDEIRAVVIAAAGRAFCSGADLKDGAAGGLTKDDGMPDLERALHERYHPIITGLRRLPKPVLSAVQGPCVGVGLSLALCELVNLDVKCVSAEDSIDQTPVCRLGGVDALAEHRHLGRAG